MFLGSYFKSDRLIDSFKEHPRFESLLAEGPTLSESFDAFSDATNKLNDAFPLDLRGTCERLMCTSEVQSLTEPQKLRTEAGILVYLGNCLRFLLCNRHIDNALEPAFCYIKNEPNEVKRLHEWARECPKDLYAKAWGRYLDEFVKEGIDYTDPDFAGPCGLLKQREGVF